MRASFKVACGLGCTPIDSRTYSAAQIAVKIAKIPAKSAIIESNSCLSHACAYSLY
jgi:hypothetical protein